MSESQIALQKGKSRLGAVNGLSAKKAASIFNGLKDPETSLPVTARQIAKCRQGRVHALERLGRAE